MGIYPYGYIEFPSWFEDRDFILAQDIADLSQAIADLQTELGLNPSGDMGTVRARLFAHGAIRDSQTGGWAMLKRFSSQNIGTQAQMGGLGIGISTGGVGYGFKGSPFGEDIPAVFGRWMPTFAQLGAINWVTPGYPFASAITAISPQAAYFAASGAAGTDPVGWQALFWALPTKQFEETEAAT